METTILGYVGKKSMYLRRIVVRNACGFTFEKRAPEFPTPCYQAA